MKNAANGNGKSLKAGETFYLLSPDGFTLSFDAEPYTSIEDAKADFDIWIKSLEHQGYYSFCGNGRREKIPLDSLWERMILHDGPFYNVS